MATAPDTWKYVLEDVRGIVTNDDYTKWIAGLRFVAEVDGSILVAARDRLTYDRVDSGHRQMLQRVWRRNDPKDRPLKLACWSDLGADIRDCVNDPWAGMKADNVFAAPEAETADEDDDKFLAAGLNRDMTFDTLITGPSNARAAGLAKRIASGLPMPSPIAYLFGPQGLGKTHLLCAILNELRQRGDRRRVTYLTAEEFMTAYFEGVKARDTSGLKSLIRKNDILLIDDLQWMSGKPGTDAEFFGNLRAVTAHGGQVLLTADSAPGDLKGFSKRLISELKGAACVEIGVPDAEMRRAIVLQQAEMIYAHQDTFILTDEMVERIVNAVPGPGRELCGVLWSLQTETGFGLQPLTADMLETVIRRHQGDRPAPSLDLIKRAAMQMFDVSRSDIESSRKTRAICYPRQLGMYLSREMTSKSYPQIAHAYRKEDHTTVIHAYRKIGKLLAKEDAQTISDVEKLRQLVHALHAESG